jgi:hypothetical protein
MSRLFGTAITVLAAGLAVALAVVLGLALAVGVARADPVPVMPAPGHFAGKLVLVVEFKKGFQPETRSGRTLWAVERPFYYRTKAGDLITIPAGMTTDLASIPAFAAGAFPPDGPWLAAAVVHDLEYLSKGTGVWKGHASNARAKPYTREEADHILDEAMASLGVGVVRRVTIFEAVRAAGARGWSH